MPKVPRISGEDAVRAFKQAGFSQDRMRGSHCVLKKAGRPLLLTILLHKVCPDLEVGVNWLWPVPSLLSSAGPGRRATGGVGGVVLLCCCAAGVAQQEAEPVAPSSPATRMSLAKFSVVPA